MHGGANQGAPKENRNAWKHGGRSADVRNALALIKSIPQVIDQWSDAAVNGQEGFQ